MREYALKELPENGLERALAKAERYRVLNDPENAESICRDVLAKSPDHPAALVVLGLSITDQFARAWSRRFEEALEVFKRLAGEYERLYYTGIAWERCAKAQLDQGQVHNAAGSFEQALVYFDRAESVAPDGDPDPVLRWNRCVRVLQNDPNLAAARRDLHAPQHDVGD